MLGIRLHGLQLFSCFTGSFIGVFLYLGSQVFILFPQIIEARAGKIGAALL